MLNISRPRILAICTACLVVAVASFALAKNEQNPNDQQNQDQQQAQSSEQSSSQSAVQSDEQNQKSDQSNQGKPQDKEQQRISRDAERSADQKESSDSDQSSSAQAPNSREWPSPERYGNDLDRGNSQRSNRDSDDRRSSRRSRSSDERTIGSEDRNITQRDRSERWSPSRDEQSRSEKGASLGVNIITSDEGRGVIVQRVHSNTPAQQMGIRPGDRITRIDGEPVRAVDEFISTIRSMEPGAQVELDIIRNGNSRTISGELGAINETIARNQAISPSDEFRRYQGIISRGEPGSNQISRDESIGIPGAWAPGQRPADIELRSSRDNRQTSYEERAPQSNRSRSGDVEARLSRVEQQLDRLTQDVEEIRNTIGTRQMGVSPGGLRDSGSTDFRTRTQNQPGANQPQPNSAAAQKQDRWNTSENRFQSGDLKAARERAAQEAARRRAEATGAQLQQQNGIGRGTPPNPNTPQTPGQPPTNPQP